MSKPDRSLKTPIARVRGLGSAKDGTHHWWLQRLTALALVPLVCWFVVSVIVMAGADHAAVTAWIARPLVAVLLVLTLAITFYHAAIGMQVVYEDYLHRPWLRLACDLGTKAACLVLAALSIFSVLRIAFGG